MKAGVFLSTATSLLLSSLQVKAHGFVDSLVIDGKTFTSYLPFDDPYVTLNPPRVTRHIPDDGPVFDFNSPDMTCNKDAQLSKYRTTSHAPVSAGGQVSFHWQRWPSDHRGPVVTYMAQCPGNDCTNFDGKGNVWFKVDEAGLISGTTDTGVFASDLLIKNNLTWTVTVPQSLKPGAYLIRHEILALHSARAPQFYPHCTQLKVTGSGSSLPSGSELVAIPGVYKNDKSTMIDIWQNGQTSYPIGGPRNAKIAAYQGTNAVNLKNGIGKQPYVAGVVVKGSATPAGGSTGGGANASGSGSGGSDTPKTKKCKAKNTKRSPVPAAPAAEDKSRAVKRHVLRQQGKRRLPLQQ